MADPIPTPPAPPLPAPPPPAPQPLPDAADTAAKPWLKYLFEHPRDAARYALFLLFFMGYDLTIPAGRVSDAKIKLDAAQKQIDDLSAILKDIQKAQSVQMQAQGFVK